MFDELNPEQREAATHGDGPLLIVAGAGTGKTMTLACRVACLIDRGVRPERILLLTFSRRASRAMLERAEQATGRHDTGKVWGGTFHAVGNRLLRLYGRPAAIRPDFTVLDQADAADVMGLLREELGYANKERRFPKKDTLGAIYSRTVNAGQKISDVLKRHYPWCNDDADGIREIFRAYTVRKRTQNVMDYDDLLLFWKALAVSPETGPILSQLFDHILVDEYQDTNSLQADILAAMRPKPPFNLTVVGDDAQSIYGFRAATVKNILEFPSRFPATRVVKLERNYRSTPSILDSSNQVIALSPQRHEKTLWSLRDGAERPTLRTCFDEAEQTNAVCQDVLRRREEGIPLHRQAVLFRAAHHSDLLEVELSRRNIPYVKYGGIKFLEAAHVKDAMACLRILENPWDEVSWFRVLHLADGIGPTGARKILEQIGLREGPNPDRPSPMQRFLFDALEVPRRAGRAIQELRAAFTDSLDESAAPPASQLERIRRFLEPAFARRYPAVTARIADIEQLELLASGYKQRGRFLAELTLDPPTSTSDLAGPPLLDEDWLVLSTIHSAKGLEWDVVHVIHAADGMIPSDLASGDEDEIEEERRLLYVAMTRARDSLTIHVPQRYYRRPRGLEDPHNYAQLSRFLQPEEVRGTFDELAPAAPNLDDAAVEIDGAASVDAFLSGLWSD